MASLSEGFLRGFGRFFERNVVHELSSQVLLHCFAEMGRGWAVIGRFVGAGRRFREVSGWPGWPEAA